MFIIVLLIMSSNPGPTYVILRINLLSIVRLYDFSEVLRKKLLRIASMKPLEKIFPCGAIFRLFGTHYHEPSLSAPV